MSQNVPPCPTSQRAPSPSRAVLPPLCLRAPSSPAMDKTFCCRALKLSPGPWESNHRLLLPGLGWERKRRALESLAKLLREGELPVAQPWGHPHHQAMAGCPWSSGWDGEGSRDTKKQAEGVEAPGVEDSGPLQKCGDTEALILAGGRLFRAGTS